MDQAQTPTSTPVSPPTHPIGGALFVIGGLILLFIGGGVGYVISQISNNKYQLSSKTQGVVAQDGVTPKKSPPEGGSSACAADVKQCSDGSYVNHVGPQCEWAACPSEVNTNSNPSPTVIYQEEFFGTETVTGYLKTVEQNDWGNLKSLCTYLIITNTDSQIKRTIKQRQAQGNGLDYAESGEVGVSIDINKLSSLNLNLLKSSSSTSLVTVVLKRPELNGGSGVGKCHSLVNVQSITRAK